MIKSNQKSELATHSEAEVFDKLGELKGVKLPPLDPSITHNEQLALYVEAIEQSKKRKDWPKVVDTFLKNNPAIYVEKRYYNYQIGAFTKDSDEMLYKKIIAFLNKPERPCIPQEYTYFMQQFKAVTITPASRINPRTHFNMKNGVLELATGVLHPHSPKYCFTYCSPVIYNPKAVSGRMGEFLDEVFTLPGTRRLIEEFMGYMFVPGYPKHAMLYLYGKSGKNGKSVFLQCLQHMLGKGMSCNLDVNMLCGNDGKFHRADLDGKMANICEDLPKSHVFDSGILKRLVSFGGVRVEKKGQDGYDLQSEAKVVFSCNQLPTTSDTTDGYFRRLLIVECPNVFIPDEKLFEKLTQDGDNLSYLFNLAYNAYLYIKDNPFTIPQCCIDLLDVHKKDVDSVRGFTEDWIDFGDVLHILPKQTLYEAYLDFCKELGYKFPVAQNNFSSKFEQICESKGRKVQKAREKLGGRNQRIYRGIKFTDKASREYRPKEQPALAN